MKKLLHELFDMEENGKIREKAMLARITVSVIVIVACLVAISSSSYAFFVSNVSSGSNVVTAASFDLALEIDGVQYSDTCVTLQAGTYTITLRKTEDSTASTGFCQIKVGDRAYYTTQIGQELEFTLVLSEETAVTFLAQWGTSIYYATDECIQSGETLTP